MKPSEQYWQAMVEGNTQRCYAIEKVYGLDGYTPELVSIGLVAIEKGIDPGEAIDKYLDRE